jgi:mono/diheme cytochrome c family protein
MDIVLVGSVILVATICATIDSADAQQIGSAREGRRLAHAACAQCHGVDRAGISRNPEAPAFEDIANVPGMTSAALTVALRIWHRSMPNFVIKGHDAHNIIAYILSLKKRD